MSYENPPAGDEVQVWFENDPARRLEIRSQEGDWILAFASGSAGRVVWDDEFDLYVAHVQDPSGPFRTISTTDDWAEAISLIA